MCRYFVVADASGGLNARVQRELEASWNIEWNIESRGATKTIKVAARKRPT